MSILVVLVVPLLLVLAVVLTLRGVVVDDRDVAWLAGGPPPTDPAVSEVYRRYLRRHRTHRAVGLWLGVTLALLYGVTARTQVTFGIGNGSPLNDVLFCGLAGLVAGALSAEAYRVTARPGPVVASLAPRAESRHAGLVVAARVLLGAALVLAVSTLIRDGSGAPLGAALAGAVVVGLAEAARRAIADRRRPLLSPAAAEVDARIRAYASGAVARLELAAAAVAAGWVLSGASPDGPPWLGALTVAGVLGLLVLALVQLHRARPRPPSSFAALPATAPVG